MPPGALLHHLVQENHLVSLTEEIEFISELRKGWRESAKGDRSRTGVRRGVTEHSKLPQPTSACSPCIYCMHKTSVICSRGKSSL